MPKAVINIIAVEQEMMGFVFLQHIYIHFSNSDVPLTAQDPQELLALSLPLVLCIL